MQNKEHNIGKIMGTFGIKGELKVYSESDFVDYRFRKNALITLKKGKLKHQVKITSMRIHKQYILITINDINDINQVLDYVGFDIYTDEVAPLESDEYYIDDLIGLEVYNQNNELLGCVVDIVSLPSNDVLEIKNSEKKFLIPFVDDYIIEISDKKIIILEIEVMN